MGAKTTEAHGIDDGEDTGLNQLALFTRAPVGNSTSKNSKRTSIATAASPVSFMARAEETIIPAKRNRRIHRGLTIKPAKAERNRPTANAVCPIT